MDITATIKPIRESREPFCAGLIAFRGSIAQHVPEGIGNAAPEYVLYAGRDVFCRTQKGRSETTLLSVDAV
jgi:hypothetical protein